MVEWGLPGDVPVQGDYDGDGTTDLVVARPSDGIWYMLESESNYGIRTFAGPTFSADDWPVPADYNGDSKTDVAVWFRSTGTWFIVDSQTMETRWEIFGGPEDTPVQALSVNRP
ncbi:MAG: FG-GAP repeat domain-containing protein [Pyrinomonadaceae bacterium]